MKTPIVNKHITVDGAISIKWQPKTVKNIMYRHK